MRSIKQKILWTIILGIFVVTSAISVISFIYVKNILEKDADVITEALAAKEALKINDTLSKVESAIVVMEDYAVSSLINPATIAHDKIQLTTWCEKVLNMFSTVASGVPGATAYYLRPSPELTGDPNAGFSMSYSRHAGEFFATVPTDLTNWQERPTEEVGWYREPVNAQRGVWVEPYTKASNSTYITSYAAPLYKDGVLVGVIGMDVEFSLVMDIVDDIQVYDNGFAYLSLPNGDVFYTPAADHIMDRAHTDHGFAETHMQLYNGMTLTVHADYTDIQRDSYSILTMIILSSFVIMIGFVVFSYIMTSKITKPLKELALAAETLADGNTDVNIECESNDEIGTLSAVFKQTAEKLKGYMTYINALAYRDSLTGVRNSTAWSEMTGEMQRRMIEDKDMQFALFVADVNDLKKTNDLYGHEVGNRLLSKSSKIICDTFKHSPVFRIGGDEFVAVLEGEDYENREALAARIDELCSDTFIDVENGRVSVKVAGGLSVFNFDTDINFDDVFARADREMYLKKRTLKEETLIDT